jgi:hypothetical protein
MPAVSAPAHVPLTQPAASHSSAPLAPMSAAGADWSMWMFDQGHSGDNSQETTLPPYTNPWINGTGANPPLQGVSAQPVTYTLPSPNNTLALYVGSWTGGITPDNQCLGSLQAFDLSASTMPPPAKWKSRVCFSGTGAGPVLAPVTVTPHVVVISEGSNLVGVDPAHGTPIFTYPDPNTSGHMGAPTIAHGAMFVGDLIPSSQAPSGNTGGDLFGFVPSS